MTASLKPAAARKRTGLRRGRPVKSQRDVREALLEAARRLFSHRGFAEVGIREIASDAGVNLAMIQYYFGDKQGLYRAMLEAAATRLIEGIREIGDAARTGETPIESLLRLYIGTLTQNPWLPRLMVREVLSEEGHLREYFVERFAAEAAGLVQGVLKDAIARHRFRAELNPVMAMLSLMGMAVFPFIAFRVAGPVFNLKIDPDFRDELIAHTTALFLDGVRRR